MNRSRLLMVSVVMIMGIQLGAQIGFTDQTELLVNFGARSGVAIGIVDMNGDFKDDIIQLHEGKHLYIEYQNQPNQIFSNYYFGQIADDSEYSICAGDVDQNGINDILVGGEYSNVKVLKSNNTGTALSSTTLAQSEIFLQGTNFVDINNDGWLDVFACDDNDDPRKYRNQQNGNFVFDQSLLPTFIGNGNSGNYSSIWIDYDNDGDQDLYISKCRAGIDDATDPRRQNRLLQNNGALGFLDVAPSVGLQSGDQSWCSAFEDIDNDGDLDVFIINHGTPSRLLENDGSGNYSDITASSQLLGRVPFSATQTIMRDFDNDGFVDILVAGTSFRLFRNNGNKTFIQSSASFGGTTVTTCAIGDLNHDGYLDIYAGYPNFLNKPHIFSDRLWMNTGGSNNYFAVELRGSMSNINGIGARIELHYPCGMQIREVRSGEGYGIQNSLNKHFGIGAETSIDSVIVRWPSGTIDRLINPKANQFFRINEGDFPICPDHYDIQLDPIPSGRYQAIEQIVVSSTVPQQGSVILQSGGSILFMNNFQVAKTGSMAALIGDCQN